MDRAVLSRVNLSLETLNPNNARYLHGTTTCDSKKVIKTTKHIIEEIIVNLNVTIPWPPGSNDEITVDVVNWAYGVGAG